MKIAAGFNGFPTASQWIFTAATFGVTLALWAAPATTPLKKNRSCEVCEVCEVCGHISAQCLLKKSLSLVDYPPPDGLPDPRSPWLRWAILR
ncbi:hypothetical protein OG792_32985 [Micromonospora sp. NBC_01699]|uniref:hypothetical protein n=1 Tax=Micromonospora sp. NBC_01699 TaxID=2975984 RepID=UPI002E283C1B|nr:hypothetical protein [Micromonospora sp. NBC_01699]